MNLIVLREYACDACGHREEGGLSAAFRVNKCSIRSTSVGIGWHPWECSECGSKSLSLTGSAKLAEESETTVRAYRERKGWAS